MRQVQTYSPRSRHDAKRAPTDDEIETELMACLTLVVPAGMAPERRIEWVEVARETVRHLPLDLLRAGCEEARKRADHPAKIVPEILRVAEPLLRMRNEPDPYHVPRERHIEARNVEPRALQKILRETGYADIADKLAGREAAKPVREQHQPTRAEYLSMGVAEKDIPTWAK